MTFRKDLLRSLSLHPRSVSSLARELGLGKRDVEDDLRHMIRSARRAGHLVIVEPARCRTCGFVFGEDRLLNQNRYDRIRFGRHGSVTLSVLRTKNAHTNAV